MRGSGRCVLRSVSRYRTSNDGISKADAMSYGVLCVLSMWEGAAMAANEIGSPSEPPSGFEQDNLSGQSSVKVMSSLLDEARQLTAAFSDLVKQRCPSNELPKVKQHFEIAAKAFLELNQIPSAMDFPTLKTLTDIRVLMLAARAEVEASTHIRFTNREKAKLDKAILLVSCFWHQARLAKLRARPYNQPGFTGLGGIDSFGSLARKSLPDFLMSETYANLLIGRGGKQIVDDLLTFIESTNKAIPLSAVKTCLLIMLYLRHDAPNLIDARDKVLLNAVISKLCQCIDTMKTGGLPIAKTFEFKIFRSSYFGLDPCLGFDWRAPLVTDAGTVSIQCGQRPVIRKLFQYGNAFTKGLYRALSNPVVVSDTAYATQVASLKALQSYLLSMNPAEHVFQKADFLEIIEKMSNSAEACLRECYAEGSRAKPHQTEILGVMRDGLHWCRLLCAYWEYPSSKALKETYETVVNAWLLKSLWSRKETFSLTDQERASISLKFLVALGSARLDHDLLGYSRAFLDQSVPSGFVGALFNQIFIPQMKFEHFDELTDEQNVLPLLASICTLHLLDGTATGRSALADQTVRNAVTEAFKEALKKARLEAPK
eukprot:Blabericola_migrator_1__5797@NODE_2938_length_2188_cov_440_306459_g1842_i0_p1_GENE_NODE_2938_length_2188_cov_440_306459_g1842_i0NODE_2938_length_2188_cov_440_306459_g1842_i0_p1_ORF_typecomplete_len600_score74_86Talin_middle/PF09141_10/0_23_NODE_2938_length_2188_cov_440_306459_g1842_i01661965